jgi:hypothetical protein
LAGPGLGGLFAQAADPVTGLLADAVSFAVSTVIFHGQTRHLSGDGEVVGPTRKLPVRLPVKFPVLAPACSPTLGLGHCAIPAAGNNPSPPLKGDDRLRAVSRKRGRLVRKRLLGILALVILGFSSGIPAATASTAHTANPELATHLSGPRIAATPQFLDALKKAREAGRGVAGSVVTGICWSGTSLCWRDMPSGAIDMWNRDISGDPRQQWVVVYEGNESQTGCTAGGGVGIYAFIGYNGYYASAAYTPNGGQAYYVGDGDSYDYWAWGTSGALLNCADTRNNENGAYGITSPPWSEGEQLWTASIMPFGYTPFEQIKV